FDFCGDGSSDVVYRGQEYLRVIEGATGKVKWQDNCSSATHFENPLILDVDADGQTEILIQCGTGPDLGTVVAYEAVGSPGIASRRVWNQHAYFNTNINDDLSVPRYQQNPHVVGDSLRLNAFLNQYFNPTFPSPDGTLSLKDKVWCEGDSLVVTIELCNPGDNLLPPLTPVSAYAGNPQTTAATWIGAVPMGFALGPDSCRTLSFRIPRVANDSIFILLNDDHSIPTPFNLSTDFPSTTLGECSFLNNIAAFYFPYQPAALDLGPDTAICDHTSLLLQAGGQDLIGWLWHDGSAQDSFRADPWPGTFAVTVTDVCGLQQVDSITVSVDSATVVNIGVDKVMCQGEEVQFSESGFDFYHWTGQGLTCADCPIVSAGPSKSGALVLEAGFSNGCVNRDSAYITVYDTFNYRIDTTLCYGRTVLWNGFTIEPDSSRTFYLSTVHGCDSTVQVRVVGTKVGTFNIQVDTSVCLGSTLPYNGFSLQAGDSKTYYLSAHTGCDSTVLVHVAPRDTFWTTESRTICNGETSAIFGTPQGSSGVFRKKFTARNGCDSTHTVTLLVRSPILVTLDATPTCFGEATGTISASVTGFSPFQYDWHPAAPPSPLLNDLPAGAYALTVTDKFDCTETASVEVPAHPPIHFEAVPDSVNCFGENSGSIVITSPDTTLLYSLDNNLFSQQTTFPGLYAGPYELFAQDVYGCIDTAQLNIHQPPALVVDLPADQSLNLGDSLALSIIGSGLPPFHYTWSDSSFLSCANCPEPVTKPLRDIRYVLTVTDGNGCTATDQMALRVSRYIDVYVPNALSIHPKTDLESRFDISYGAAVKQVRLLQVFDRWGNLLHEVRNASPQDQSRSWNGQYKGDPVMPGVYVWLLELELVDGSIERRQGDVTVLR
ncbi:MAG TPA: gliding motility-associated C-terminal domain-containing protein, partial [Saprospiraceae bacterium]|nr:gliding motility-associated C-terminal domain-containing protein [Saprospiraceae bacterium]